MGLFKKIDIELNYDYLITEYLESDEDYLEFYLPDRQQKVFVNDFTNYIIDQADINEDAILKAFDEWVETEILKYDGYIEVKIDEGCEDYYVRGRLLFTIPAHERRMLTVSLNWASD